VNTGIPFPRLAVDREGSRQRLRIAEDALAVGVFGRLVKEKGQDVLFRAARDSGEFEVHCFGSGPMQRAWEKEFAGPHVRFHGHVTRVVDAMIGMDVVCVPSVWPEALGLVVLEAMSLGLPVVASKVGGIPEAVANGVNGILVQAGDPDAITQAVARFRTDGELATRLGSAARAYYEKERTPAQMAEQTEAAYYETLGWA
jgi:glycosyltransferase involved in cell wall biosynthesis